MRATRSGFMKYMAIVQTIRVIPYCSNFVSPVFSMRGNSINEFPFSALGLHGDFSSGPDYEINMNENDQNEIIRWFDGLGSDDLLDPQRPIKAGRRSAFAVRRPAIIRNLLRF